MFEKPISRDADKAICQIYKCFLEKRKNGEPKNSAKRFNAQDDKFKNEFLKSNPDDFNSSIQELKRASMLTTYIDGGFELKDEAVIYMANCLYNGTNENSECACDECEYFLECFGE